MAYRFSLASGRSVSLEALHVERTYAGLLEGKPTPEYNDAVLARKSSRMTKVWGDRPTHLLRPEPSVVVVEDGGSREHVVLPALTYHAWLTSSPIDSRYGGSELVLIWFGPNEPEFSIPSIVGRAVRDIAWESVAAGFDY